MGRLVGPLGSSTITIINKSTTKQHKRQLNATSLSIHTTQDAALARDLSTQSGALTGRFAGGSSAGVQGYAYQNAKGPESRARDQN